MANSSPASSLTMPLQFAPLLKRARWGGRRLAALGKALGEGSDFAEAWEICDHGADQSLVNSGPFQGWSLQNLIRKYPEELCGLALEKEPRRQFPLLVKFLDAHDRLSVQVHPGDELARQFDPLENGKTEAWIILEAEPGSRIFAGLQPGTTRAQFQHALETNRLAECLHSQPVSPGECYLIPAGTVHAIGEGVLIAEIQQSSDLTFRLHDWGRLGTDGQPRTLHIPQALQCTTFPQGPISPSASRLVSPASASARVTEELARCPYFVIHRHTSRSPQGPAPLSQSQGCSLLILLQGELRVSTTGGSTTLSTGQTCLIPAGAQPAHCESSATAQWLEVFLPDNAPSHIA